MNLYFLDLIRDSKIKEREKVQVYFEYCYHDTDKVEYCYNITHVGGRMIVLKKYKNKRTCGMDFWYDQVTFYYLDVPRQEYYYRPRGETWESLDEVISKLKDNRGKNFNHRCILMYQLLHY
jgi:hypothetical protein